MLILFILGLVLGVLSVIFVVQNTAVVTVSFFSWQLTGSLAFILTLAIGTGILFILLIILPESVNNYFKFKSLERENAKLADELKKQRELAFLAEKKAADLEVVSNGEKGLY